MQWDSLPGVLAVRDHHGGYICSSPCGKPQSYYRLTQTCTSSVWVGLQRQIRPGKRFRFCDILSPPKLLCSPCPVITLFNAPPASFHHVHYIFFNVQICSFNPLILLILNDPECAQDLIESQSMYFCIPLENVFQTTVINKWVPPLVPG